MKLKSLALSSLLLATGVNSAFAQHHYFPGAEKEQAQTVAPGYCEIELYNNTFETISVYAEFKTFNREHIIFMMHPQEVHYVSLDYNGYCHDFMYLEGWDDVGLFYGKGTLVDSTLIFRKNLKQNEAVLKKK